MDSLHRFANEATTAFLRAKQYTEEKIGHTEKTQYDPQFENMLRIADRTKTWTEKISKQMESVVQPNLTVRVEDFVMDKLDKKRRTRVSNTEVFGQTLVAAGNDYGLSTAYGSALSKAGEAEMKIGTSERQFIDAVVTKFIRPYRNYLDSDFKSISKERKILNARRLDLDVCKNKLKKAVNAEKVQAAEVELRSAQADFDRQYEMTKLVLDGVGSTHTSQLRCLSELVEEQLKHYATGYRELVELKQQLASISAFTGSPQPTANVTPGDAVEGEEKVVKSATNIARRAKVLYDYDAADETELSLLADEIVTVYTVPGMEDDDWIMAERGNQRGKVPTTYIAAIP